MTFEAGPYVYRGTAVHGDRERDGRRWAQSDGRGDPTRGDCTNVTSANGCTATATFARRREPHQQQRHQEHHHHQASSTTVVTFEAGPYVYRGTAVHGDSERDGRRWAQSDGRGGPTRGDCTNVTSTNGCTATATFARRREPHQQQRHQEHHDHQASSTTVVTFEAGPIRLSRHRLHGDRERDGRRRAQPDRRGGLHRRLHQRNEHERLHGDAEPLPAIANHTSSSDTKSITIEKASSTTAVAFEAGPYMYRGTAFTATANVTGVGWAQSRRSRWSTAATAPT